MSKARIEQFTFSNCLHEKGFLPKDVVDSVIAGLKNTTRKNSPGCLRTSKTARKNLLMCGAVLTGTIIEQLKKSSTKAEDWYRS